MGVGVSVPQVETQAPAAGVGLGADPRPFRRAAMIAVAATAVPYLWVLTDLWNSSPSLLRTASESGYASNFYDLQARAMLAGRLSVPTGSLLIEAFIHDGRTYTYFGLFPSLLRIPVLVVTHSLDGRLTALSMLAAWLVTALFAPLLIWRVRVFSRGQVPLGAAETVALGALVGAITGGSVLVFLAASPNVFSEDLAWSVALTLGSLFGLLGVLERPSRGRVVFSGVLILAANLTRAPTGYACVIGAVLVSIWFASGQSGAQNRRWWAPVLAAGIVPLAVGCAVNMAKFGVPFGRPNGYFGGPNGGPEFGLRYMPSTLFAYLRPDAIRLTPSLPVHHAPGPGGPRSRRRFGERHADSQSDRDHATAFRPRCLGFDHRLPATSGHSAARNAPFADRRGRGDRSNPDLRIPLQSVSGGFPSASHRGCGGRRRQHLGSPTGPATTGPRLSSPVCSWAWHCSKSWRTPRWR